MLVLTRGYQHVKFYLLDLITVVSLKENIIIIIKFALKLFVASTQNIKSLQERKCHNSHRNLIQTKQARCREPTQASSMNSQG